MSRLIIADPALCIGCHTYETTCSETHRQHGLQSMPRLRVMLNEKESAPQLYHHCKDTLCATVYPVSAVTRAGGVMQLNESLCVNCKLCGIACPFGAIEFSGNRSLDIPANANTPEAPPTPPTPARASTLLDQAPDIRAIAVKCDFCSFGEQGPACVRMYPTKALHLVDSTDITHVSKHKHELTFNTDLGDLTLFQQAQSGEARRAQFP